MNLSENSTVKLSLVITLLGAVASGFYFVGTAHSKIADLDQRFNYRSDDLRDTHKILMDIDRRLSRIEGRLTNIGKRIDHVHPPD